MLTSVGGKTMSSLTRRETGVEMLLLLEVQVYTLPRSLAVRGPTERLFWTTWLYVLSYDESTISFSRHQVTAGLGSPDGRTLIEIRAEGGERTWCYISNTKEQRGFYGLVISLYKVWMFSELFKIPNMRWNEMTYYRMVINWIKCPTFMMDRPIMICNATKNL